MEESSKEVSSWKPWQIALAVGTPVALGIAGVWYIKSRRKSVSKGLDKTLTPKPDVQTEQKDHAQRETEQVFLKYSRHTSFYCALPIIKRQYYVFSCID